MQLPSPSVAAIVITGVVLIQGYRDTAALHAKLDEIVVSLKETRNDVVGLEHAEPEEIRAKRVMLEEEATQSNVLPLSRDASKRSNSFIAASRYMG